ncbi:PREDICTED: pentatricopeptide repeat-containing protein At3g25210, mitochondrial [Nelumbo nucifera]|uniref:Pentatricopeptide repeat-containing protein At3g25210, mitochondrial n=1 Tax=Nelumbo nucifera TaxID=4432 RepID=A0A1U7Z436_NELNU|nr:PREDICTED: pentatricopeptide repeat-containing protein At3g25210, mitochondrial [Nelumbo nucifera]
MEAVHRRLLGSFLSETNRHSNLSPSLFRLLIFETNSIPISPNPKQEPATVSTSPSSYFSCRSIVSATSFLCSYKEHSEALTPPPEDPRIIRPRTRTPLEKQFETWVEKLKPGFTPADVDDALRSQSDPDLALDIFRWTAQQRGYKHNQLTYHTMFQIAVSGKRFGHAETLIEEVLAGACSGSLNLYNSMIRFCCSRKPLFNRAFDVYRKMQRSQDCKPTLETYTLLLNALLRKFNKLNVCYAYMHSVRSLLKQMKASGVIPDTFALNLIIKAYSKCLEMDEAIRVFREMGLYACEPNAYTYSYIAKGLCEKGRVSQGFGFYKEMRDKGLVPTSSTYMILICSLSMERRFEDANGVLFDMLNNSMVPDLLTYRTLFEELCREGRGNEAFQLLEELRKKEGSMEEKTYKTLLDGLHFLCRE